MGITIAFTLCMKFVFITLLSLFSTNSYSGDLSIEALVNVMAHQNLGSFTATINPFYNFQECNDILVESFDIQFRGIERTALMLSINSQEFTKEQALAELQKVSNTIDDAIEKDIFFGTKSKFNPETGRWIDTSVPKIERPTELTQAEEILQSSEDLVKNRDLLKVRKKLTNLLKNYKKSDKEHHAIMAFLRTSYKYTSAYRENPKNESTEVLAQKEAERKLRFEKQKEEWRRQEEQIRSRQNEAKQLRAEYRRCINRLNSRLDDQAQSQQIEKSKTIRIKEVIKAQTSKSKTAR